MPSADKPLITAVMITGMNEARYPLARIAVQCFHEQTYPNRELLIINHGPISLNDGQSGVREIHVHKRAEDTVGWLRNIGLKHSRGKYIIAWDDDDWHAPERIETQFAALGGWGIVVLRNQIRYNLTNGCAFYQRCREGIAGTILHLSDVPFRYLNMVRGSDTEFMLRFRNIVVLQNKPSLYIRTFHGLNLWDAKHVMKHLAHPKLKDRVELVNTDRLLLERLTQRFGDVYKRFRQQDGGATQSPLVGG